MYLTSFVLLQRVHLDIQVGEHAVDYAHVAQKEKLSELQLRVRQLLDQVEQITKEQNYQRVSLKNINSMCTLKYHLVIPFVTYFIFNLGFNLKCPLGDGGRDRVV